MTEENTVFRHFIAGIFLLLLGAATPVAARASPPPETATPTQAARFATPQEAASALVAAARADNVAAMHDVLGAGSVALLYSGDPVSDELAREKFVAAYDAKHSLTSDALGRMVLMPIPIVKDKGQWHFDSFQGARDLALLWQILLTEVIFRIPESAFE